METKNPKQQNLFKFVMIRGAGFFADAYDLFVMNIVNVILSKRYPGNTDIIKGAISTAVFAGSVCG